MPRTYVRRPGERVARRQARYRVPVARWIDMLWFVQGSTIEKMVMAEFIRRGIYFEHTPQTNTIGFGVDPTWEPDFLLPQYKIWIEIQGGYFHTLPGQAEADAFRFATIEAAGWKPIFWWEDDIRDHTQKLFDDVPEFYRIDDALQHLDGYPRGTEGNWFEGGTGIDHLKGLRTALSHRTKPVQFTVRRRTVGRRPK